MTTLIDYMLNQLLGEGHHEVDIQESKDKVVVDIYVDSDKIAKVIGRQGKTAKAIKTLVKAVNKDARKCDVSIKER